MGLVIVLQRHGMDATTMEKLAGAREAKAERDILLL
jgi:hypothetical protein